jgi:hypothetical protein
MDSLNTEKIPILMVFSTHYADEEVLVLTSSTSALNLRILTSTHRPASVLCRVLNTRSNRGLHKASRTDEEKSFLLLPCRYPYRYFGLCYR